MGVATFLGGCHLRLSQVDAASVLFFLFILLRSSLLLVEDLALLLSLASVTEALYCCFFQVLGTESFHCGIPRYCLIELKSGPCTHFVPLVLGVHELAEKLVMLAHTLA